MDASPPSLPLKSIRRAHSDCLNRYLVVPSVDRPQTKLPRLKQATTPDGRLIAIVSNEDLSAGLVAYQTTGPIGYTPQSATDLMRNILLWSASR